jgi:hypothetical protein
VIGLLLSFGALQSTDRSVVLYWVTVGASGAAGDPSAVTELDAVEVGPDPLVDEAVTVKV